MDRPKAVMPKRARLTEDEESSKENSLGFPPEEFTGNSLNEFFTNSPIQHVIKLPRVSVPFNSRSSGILSIDCNTRTSMRCSSDCQMAETVISLQKEVAEMNLKFKKLLYTLTLKEKENQILRHTMNTMENTLELSLSKDYLCASNCEVF